MFHTLLVPIDGSPFSERALTLAVPIAQQHGASLVLTMAHPLPSTTDGVAGMTIRNPVAERDVRQHLRQHLERVARRIATKYRVTTSTQFREGPTVDEIEQAAADASADLIVLTTHGRGGLSRMWLGGVTDALLRRATRPVLVTRTARKWTLTTANEPVFPRIIVALDGSPNSERALADSLRLVGDNPGHLVLVRAEDAAVASLTNTWVAETIRALQADYLEPIAATHRTRALQITTRAVVQSDAARAILDVAKEENAFMIAVATHGRTGFRRALLGSVADKVIRGASVPVLVCPAS